jgi:hypothetical protein
MSIGSKATIPDIQLKVTYGYPPNIRTIIQTVSASNLKQGLNTIKLEDPKLLKEIKANPEMKLIPSLTFYPSLDTKYTNIVNNATPGEVYYPPKPKYYQNIPEGDLLLQLDGLDVGLDVFNNDLNALIISLAQFDNAVDAFEFS